MCFFVWVCKRGQSCACVCLLLSGAQQVTIRNHDKYTHSQPFRIWIVVIYCTFTFTATCRVLTLASVIDITGGLKLTGTELWISNSNVSQVSIGLYTPHCQNSVLDYSVFVLRGWSYNSVWLQRERLFCNSRMATKYCVQLWKISPPPPSICSSWIYYDQALVCSGLEDNQCSPRGENIFPPKRVSINIDLIYTKMYTCGIWKDI